MYPGFDSLSPGVSEGLKEKGDTVGQYSLNKRLGQGMYGVVYRAVARDRTVVAIKAIDRNSLVNQASGVLDEKKKAYVQHEIRVMQSVDHPNVVRLLEPLYSASHIYLVLEYCDLDVAKYCQPRPPLSESVVQR